MKKYIVMTFLSILVIMISIVWRTTSKEASKDTGSNSDFSVTEPQLKEKESESNKEAGKVLVVYFSLTGNTDKVAGIIKDMTGGDIFKIQPDFDYFQVKSSEEMEELGKKQVEEDFKPALKNSVSNFDDYDYFIIGSPVWWYSVTPPVMSFLSQYDFTDKTVIPFCTYGSAYGGFFKQFKDAVPGAKLLEEFSITEAELQFEEERNKKIETWLTNINLLRQ